MIMTEKEDLALAGKIIEQYNLVANAELTGSSVDEERVDNLEEEIDTKAVELYGNEIGDYDIVTVPVELFHRLAVETDHHKAMLQGKGSGVVATLGGSASGEMEYGVAKDLKFEFRVALRAPDGDNLNDEEIDKIVDCAIEAWRATLVREADTLKAEMAVMREKFGTPN